MDIMRGVKPHLCPEEWILLPQFVAEDVGLHERQQA